MFNTVEQARSTGDDDADNDLALVTLLRAGESAAFEPLVRDYGGRLLAVAGRMLNSENDACDAVQETFITAFRSIDRFERKSQLATWLHRIVVNASLMKL